MKIRLTGKNWPAMAHAADYSVSILAKHCQISVRQLERFFRKNLGKAPHCWMRDLRQEEALKLLSAGKMVKETALELGYKSVAHFSRDFKHKHGHSPSQKPQMLKLSIDLSHLGNKCRVSANGIDSTSLSFVIK